MIRLACQIGAAAIFLVGIAANGAHAADKTNVQIARGKYLVSVIPCTDCHTPGTFLGHPQTNRYLGGSEVGFEIPGLGIFYGPNLTPDKETGLGNWTNEQIATAIRTGKRPDGRILGPPMPVESFKHLSQSDALAIAAYLKTLPPIKHKVPGPLGPGEKPPAGLFVYQVIPADKYVPTPPPSK
jgi:mono/diheme cytochrome c family protein